MSRKKIILFALLIAFIAIQFVRPARNYSGQASLDYIGRVFTVPKKVDAILKSSCYDCHSNNTRYPWYAEIQPSGWWLAYHIKKGKSELNFDEFGTYSKRRQDSKMKSIENSIKDGTMPLPSYLWIHKNAKLTKEDKSLLLNWVKKTRDSLSLNIRR